MQPIHDATLENWHDFEIVSRREIIALLRAIGEKKQLIRMLIHGEADVCVTSILEVDADGDQLILDCSINKEQNLRALAASGLRFETTLDKIRILFAGPGIEASMFEGSAAFSMPIPQTMVRLQRREYYRMDTPVSNPVRVSLTMPPQQGGGIAVFPLADISCGGIALLDAKMELDNTIGLNYLGCRLDLPEIGPVPMTLQVRNSLDLTLLNGKPNRRLGMEFVNLTRGGLAQVQRYITKLERERNARLAGLA
ncbi:MAG: flagellar brake protein [Pseudomonadota bacterium]